MGIHTIAKKQSAYPEVCAHRAGASEDFVFLSQCNDVSFAGEACIDVLRTAQRLTGTARYQWVHHIATVDTDYAALCHESQTLVLIGNVERPWIPSAAKSQEFRACLRKAARVCIVGSAVFVPITLGIAYTGRVSVHPNFAPSLYEIDPMVDLTNSTVHHEANLTSAISPMAAIPMMVDLVGACEGEFTRKNLTKYLGLSDPDAESGAIDLLRYQRRAEGNPIISKALRTMQEHLEDTLTIRQLTEAIDVSPRQLERHFREFLGESPLKVYRALRLDRARVLLAQTSLPLYEVSLASGFSNATLMKRWFIEKYGEQPLQVRRQAYGGLASV